MIFTKQTILAMQIAEQYHHKQVDKLGVPYIVHLLHVAETMETEDEVCVALLHDLLEDTNASLETLSVFSEEIQNAIVLLTRNTNESYRDYIFRLKFAPNSIVRKVKIADILEHLDPTRVDGLSDSLKSRYLDALFILLQNSSDRKCEKCRHQILGSHFGELVCANNCLEFQENGIGCQQFSSRYIEFPICVTSIDNRSDQHYTLYPCGKPVRIRVCEDKKTYFGILLGELPIQVSCSHNKNTGHITIQMITNPAIYVPELSKIIYGYESWWERIDSIEEAKKMISDSEINNVWYMRLLRDMFGTKE